MRNRHSSAEVPARLQVAAMLATGLLYQGFALAAPAGKSSAAAKAHATLAALDLFAQLVVDKGHDAQVPPHLSKMLLLNDGAGPTPVRQVAIRVGTVVHDFNVVSVDHRQRVLFTSDETTRLTKAYALRPDGSLRLALQYVGSGVSEPMSPAAGRTGYQREVKFWSEYVHGKPVTPTQGLRPAAPLPAQPAPDAAATHP